MFEYLEPYSKKQKISPVFCNNFITSKAITPLRRKVFLRVKESEKTFIEEKVY